MHHRRLIPLAAAILVAAMPAASASAQGSGVTIDPDSPTGKEYAIPFETARRNATEGGGAELGTPQQGARSAPLFGEGVGDEIGATSGGAGPKGATKDSRSGDSSTPAGPGAGGRSKSNRAEPDPGGEMQDAIAGTQAVRATIPDGGIGSAATIGAVALSVLLLGGVLGSIARRRNAG